jgi:uncharacterized protein
VDHLQHAGLPFDEQRRVFLEIAWADPLLREALIRARALGLPDWRIVSGALYNSVWNALTKRPSGYGIKDIDLFYCDTGDLSYEAEDEVIRAGSAAFSGMPIPVEIRNQARVHLWYPEKFGHTCPQFTSADQSIGNFASKTHAVGVRLEGDGSLDLYAPFGLDDIFSFRVTPNRNLNNRQTHEQKSARAKRHWPELTIVPW